MQIRPYQQAVIDEVEQHARPLIVAPTGSGKTCIAAEIIRRAEHKHVLFFAHRRELVFQPRDTLAKFGIDAGVILSGESLNRSARVQVASIQTLHARCIRGKDDLPPADLVIIDEAHHVAAVTYQSIIAKYPDAKLVGLTATPCRRDGRGLGSVFSALVEAPQVAWLTENGFLVKTRVYAPSTPDLAGVHTRLGDYVESELAAAVDRPKLVGNIVEHWHRLAERRRTIVFGTSVSHAIHLADEFAKSGVRAAHINGETPKEERDEILARLSRGELEVVTNCMVCCEGWDSPTVSCAVLARPTKSMGLYRQMAGRVLRPAEGKIDALVLDHAGCTKEHGFLHDEMYWSLDENHKATSERTASRSKGEGSGLVECKECHAIRVPGKPCSECGYFPKRPGTFLDVADGDLALVQDNGRLQPHQYSFEERRNWHGMFVHIAKERGYKIGWASWKFKEKFGAWPTDRNVDPIPPSPEVLSYERHLRIRFAKSKARAA